MYESPYEYFFRVQTDLYRRLVHVLVQADFAPFNPLAGIKILQCKCRGTHELRPR